MRNFINISDIPVSDLRLIIENAKLRKSKREKLNKSEFDADKPFFGKTMAMICLLYTSPSPRDS